MKRFRYPFNRCAQENDAPTAPRSPLKNLGLDEIQNSAATQGGSIARLTFVQEAHCPKYQSLLVLRLRLMQSRNDGPSDSRLVAIC
ncbi:hypothetical protein Poly41_27910 [Novipirellula artificiosorum]|uniref:Uncharacterized protein n=1 Tax=Novipirellula artificiosorum TaxID=2528016 RepID=A0A5C6DQ06_9BACT|nr:hypothetical protein Poly41_27910 [Novipirellula artificiosorum]